MFGHYASTLSEYRAFNLLVNGIFSFILLSDANTKCHRDASRGYHMSSLGYWAIQSILPCLLPHPQRFHFFSAPIAQIHLMPIIAFYIECLFLWYVFERNDSSSSATGALMHCLLHGWHPIKGEDVAHSFGVFQQFIHQIYCYKVLLLSRVRVRACVCVCVHVLVFICCLFLKLL